MNTTHNRACGPSGCGPTPTGSFPPSGSAKRGGAIRGAERWPVDPAYFAELRRSLGVLVAEYALRNPGVPGLPVEAARHWMGLPDRSLVETLVCAPLAIRRRHIVAAGTGTGRDDVARPIEALAEELAGAPFAAADTTRLAELGFTRARLGVAAREGLLVRVTSEAFLLPEAVDEAVRLLAGLPQPFTARQAGQALNAGRRATVPLLRLLDRRGLTRRVDSRRRTVTPHPPHDRTESP